MKGVFHMKHIEEYLLEEMSKAIEKKQELELQLMIAEREYESIRAAYRALKQYQGGETA
jgi:hypothetical protein